MLFRSEGLLDPLTSALLNMMATRGEVADQMKKKIVQIVLVFSQVTQSDIHVRHALGTRKIVRRKIPVALESLKPHPEHPCRFASGVRASGAAIPRKYAEGCQTPFNECHFTRGTAKCECIGNSDSTSG